jgi:hypothetical protein
MADRYPNIPSLLVDFQDGNLQPDAPPAGPAVLVLGTAKKGPAKTESRVVTGLSGLARFGLSGTLGRTLTEVFQGGGTNALAYRILATRGSVAHIGDVTGVGGYTVETATAGSDALSKIAILYDNEADILKVYTAVSGQLIFSNDPEAPVDLGVVTVTGEQEPANPHGSIGRAIKLRTDESLQRGTRTTGTTFTVSAGSNAALLRFNATSNPSKIQVLSGLSGATEKTAVRLATAAALAACTYDNDDGTLTADATGVEQIDGTNVAVGNRILVKNQVDPVQNGIYTVTTAGAVGTAQVLTRATDADAAGELSQGMYVDVSAGSANIGKSFCLVTAAPTNGFVLGTTELEFAEINADPDTWLVEANVTEVSGAVVTHDGSLSATAFPAIPHKVRFFSSAIGERADKILSNRLFLSEAAAENGGVQPIKVLPGSDFNGLPLVSNDSGWLADVEDSDGVLALEEVGPAKMNLYEALQDAGLELEASEFSYVLLPGAYADDPALDGRTTGATALPSEALAGISEVNTIDSMANAVDVTFDDNDALLVALAVLEAGGRGDFWAVFTTAQGDDFGLHHEEGELVRTARVLNWEENADDDTILRLFFDREVSFSLTEAEGVVAADLNPAMSVYETDLLLYYRNKEVDGVLRHMWYPEKSDEDGFTYSEVNFAYAMARFCSDMTKNEIAVQGVIGVRPPANHFSPAAVSRWIGKSPSFLDGEIVTNGSGLLGNKFVAGLLLEDETQFLPGYKETTSTELDGAEIVLDANGAEVDLGKFLSTVAGWLVFSNVADSSGLGYVNSASALYAGLLASLEPWRGATAKPIGGTGVRVPLKLAKRHQDALSGSRYIVFDQKRDGVIVVDAPTSALPISDFTRNMTVRLASEAVEICREVARPFLGDALTGLRKAALDTELAKSLSALQKDSGGALESFTVTVTQTNADKVRGSARLTLTLKIINELRKIVISVGLTQ